MNINPVNQGIDSLTGVASGFVGQVGVSGCRQDADMAENFLQFEEVNARFQQMSCKAVTQGMA